MQVLFQLATMKKGSTSIAEYFQQLKNLSDTLATIGQPITGFQSFHGNKYCVSFIDSFNRFTWLHGYILSNANLMSIMYLYDSKTWLREC
jgi:hypothetical protein